MSQALRVHGFLAFVLTLLAICSDSFAQSNQIEALKKQIEEIQRQNQEKIEEIQRQNQEQIDELRSKIEEMETDRKADQEKIRDIETGRETDEQNLEALLTKKLGEVSPLLTKFKFNPDFPSYYRTRAFVFKDATFTGAVDGEDDDIFFVDSRLLLSPMIEVSDNLSLRSQIEVAKNIIWGGLGDVTISDKVFEAPSPADSFRGALLREVTNTVSGEILSPVDEDVDFFDIRSLYVFARVPIGELYVGRQPFDWALGILNNAGSMPDQDLGSIVDRFELDTAPFSFLGENWRNWLFALSIDRLSQGRSIARGADGKGWQIGIGSLYEAENLEVGGYIFLVNQNSFDISQGLTADLDNAVNWSLYAKLDLKPFFLSFEFQDLFGEVNNLDDPLPFLIGDNSIDISAENFLLAVRVGYDPPPTFIDVLVAEFGWASGDDARTPDKLEGNAIYFNNAYTVDNLLFKHMIPNIYALEGSVINSLYLRTWSTIKLTDFLSFTPQALLAWVDEPNALSLDLLTPLPKVDRFLGAELEGTFTLKILDHLWFDLIGSVVISGNGLDDLISQRAFIEGAIPSIDAAEPAHIPFAFQGRLVFTLDPIIRTWTGSSSLRKRAWFQGDYL